MRTLLLAPLVALVMCFLMPSGTSAEDCNCESIVSHQFTCFECGAKVQVSVCQGGGNSCTACQNDAVDLQCCPNEFIGSAEPCGTCGDRCGQQVLTSVAGTSLHRFYAPACTGGLKTMIVALN